MQVQIIESLRDNRTTAVRSCHGSGKTWTAARAIMWFLLAYPGSVCLSTAPTYRQVVELIWREIRTAYGQSVIPIGGRLLKDKLELGSDWFALGLSTSTPDYFQGFHSEHVLMVVDEPPGVDEVIFAAIDGILSTASSRMLMIGNPTSLSGRFYNSFKNPDVAKIRISVFDTPNFYMNNIKTIDDLRNKELVMKSSDKLHNNRLVSPIWAREKLLEWGEDSPMFQSRVMGNFPSQAENTLIPLNKIEQATTDERREMLEKKYEGTNPLRYYGMDVARFGSDSTVILSRIQDIVDSIKSYQKEDTMQTTGRAIAALTDKPGRMNIDIIGIGSGVYDRMIELEIPYTYGVNVAQSAIQPDRFTNLRAELFWILREKFINDEIYIPYDETLMADLASLEYSFTSRGQIQLESKDEIKKRIGRSPDMADALALSYNGFASSGGSVMKVGKQNIFRRVT